MKKTLLIAILFVAAGWLGGCSVSYEEHPRRRHRPVVCAPPVEVIHVPPHHPRPRRPYRRHRPPHPCPPPWR